VTLLRQTRQDPRYLALREKELQELEEKTRREREELMQKVKESEEAAARAAQLEEELERLRRENADLRRRVTYIRTNTIGKLKVVVVEVRALSLLCSPSGPCA
jgi:chromosome segregation ATPase